MTLLVLGLLVALLGLRWSAPGGACRQAAPLALLFGYLLPSVLLAWTFFAHQESAARLRYALLGFGFRAAPGRPLEVALGGDRKTHDVWISALNDAAPDAPSPGRLVFRPTGDQGSPQLLLEPAVSPAGFLGARAPGGRVVPLGAVELAEGDKLRVAGRAWTVQLSHRPFTPPARFVDPAGLTVDLPRRRSEIPLFKVKVPVGRPLPASEETFALGFLEKSATGHLPAPLPRAYLFRQPGLLRAGGIYLAAPDGSAAVERGGRLLARPDAIPLPAGHFLHVLSDPRWDGTEFAARGQRDRRSFRVDVAPGGFTLQFETPDVYSLPWRQATAQDPRIGLYDLAFNPRGKGNEDELEVGLTLADWSFLDKSLYFPHASRRIAEEALAFFTLPPSPGAAGREYVAATPRGQRQALFGRPVWLGGHRSAAVQLDLLQPPLWLALLALFLALAKAVAARAAGLSNAALLAAVALEGVLVLRLLVGYRVWAMAPFSEEAWQLSLVAWMLIPWVFLAAALPPRGGAAGYQDPPPLAAYGPALAGLALAASWCWHFGGGRRALVWVACAVLAAALPWLRGDGIRGRLRRTSRTANAVLTRRAAALAQAGDRLGARVAAFVRSWRTWPVWVWFALAFVPLVLRGILLFLGFKESIPLFGQRLALSLVHIPLALLFQAGYLAWLWPRVERQENVRLRDLVPAVGFVMGTWILPGLAVNDQGLFLLNVPVFLAACAPVAWAGLRQALESHTGWRYRLAPTVSLVALLLYLLFSTVPLFTRLGADLIARVKTEQEEYGENAYLRLLAFAWTEQLGAIAQRKSEELVVMNKVMASYTARPLSKCRYFSSELSPHLKATALREHATAIFLAAEWSILGVLGAVLLYLAVARAGWALAPWRSEDRDSRGDWSRFLALFAASTLAIASLYMILANYRLTLFTGKNVYLLGLDSTADVLESLLLVGLYALAAARVRALEEAA